MTSDEQKKATERSLIGSIASNVRWAHTDDRAAATQAARDAFNAKFEAEVDPDGVLDPVERARRASYARRAHFQRMALAKAQKARAAKKTPRRKGGDAGQDRRE